MSNLTQVDYLIVYCTQYYFGNDDFYSSKIQFTMDINSKLSKTCFARYTDVYDHLAAK